MKKLLVMLLALCMVLSMSVALVACSDDEEPASSADESVETSEDASSEADASADASAEDATSEEESSEDASAGDATSEEESSEEESSEEESSAVVYDYKTSVAGTNYAATSTYTAYRADLGEGDDSFYLNYPTTSDWADVENTKLTDGVVGDASTYDTTAAAQAGITVQYAGTSKDFVFIFDLGEHYGDIKSLDFLNVRNGTPNGNNRGFSVKLVQYSDDSESWTRAKGNLTSVQVAGIEIESKNVEGEKNVEHCNFTYTFDQTLQCRYIKITLTPGEADLAKLIPAGYVLQMEEIEIHN